MAFYLEQHSSKKTIYFLSSFVSKITKNTAIDRYRKRNAQKRVDSHMEDIAGEVEKIGSAISSDIEIYLKKRKNL